MAFFHVESVWDYARVGSYEIDLSSGAGGPWLISFTTGKHVHKDVFTAGVSAHPTALKAALDASPDTSTYTVTFNTSGSNAGKYTISRDTVANFALTFSSRGAAGVRARQILGFTGDQSGASSYTSDIYPYYMLSSGGKPDVNGNSPIAAKTLIELDYSPIVTEEAEADDGTAYGTTRRTAPKYLDFALELQPKELVLDQYATGAVPWTWQKFFEHHRLHRERFGVFDNTASEKTVHRLRKEGEGFNRATREPTEPDVLNYWTIRLLTRLLVRQ